MDEQNRSPKWRQYFHENNNRQDCTQTLLGKRESSFLFRESSDKQHYAIAIVGTLGQAVHLIVEQDEYKTKYFINSKKENLYFDNIENLYEHYRENPLIIASNGKTILNSTLRYGVTPYKRSDTNSAWTLQYGPNDRSKLEQSNFRLKKQVIDLHKETTSRMGSFNNNTVNRPPPVPIQNIEYTEIRSIADEFDSVTFDTSEYAPSEGLNYSEVKLVDGALSAIPSVPKSPTLSNRSRLDSNVSMMSSNSNGSFHNFPPRAGTVLVKSSSPPGSPPMSTSGSFSSTGNSFWPERRASPFADHMSTNYPLERNNSEPEIGLNEITTDSAKSSFTSYQDSAKSSFTSSQEKLALAKTSSARRRRSNSFDSSITFDSSTEVSESETLTPITTSHSSTGLHHEGSLSLAARAKATGPRPMKSRNGFLAKFKSHKSHGKKDDRAAPPLPEYPRAPPAVVAMNTTTMSTMRRSSTMPSISSRSKELANAAKSNSNVNNLKNLPAGESDGDAGGVLGIGIGVIGLRLDSDSEFSGLEETLHSENDICSSHTVEDDVLYNLISQGGQRSINRRVGGTRGRNKIRSTAAVP